MQFYEKLDFLMNITNTSNRVLAEKVNFDPSHISRLRRGLRNAPRVENVIQNMAEYFAKQMVTDYQQKALLETLNKKRESSDTETFIKLIEKWLLEKKDDDFKAVGVFLNNLNKVQSTSKIGVKEADVAIGAIQFPQDDISVFYGNEGKRLAVEYFLLKILSHKEPQTVLLYSSEATDWLTEKQYFAKKISEMMLKILAKGNRIIIIHTVSRHLDEMLSILEQWLPLYMTGLIEPYYYPKKRDGVFRQTMFISPGVKAVISNSLGQSNNQAVNLLVRNEDAIRAYTKDFYLYLKQCKPLMNIFTAKDKVSYLDRLWEFEKEKRNAIIKTGSLTLLTMPKQVSSTILSRIGIENSNLADYQQQRQKNFKKILETNTFLEIIPVFDIKQIKKQQIKVSFSEMMSGRAVFYRKEEYIEHLKHLLYLLKKYENFHISLIEDISESDYMLYVKEELGVITAKTSTPPLVLAIDETNMTATSWDFILDVLGNNKSPYSQKTSEIKKLKNYLQIIQSI